MPSPCRSRSAHFAVLLALVTVVVGLFPSSAAADPSARSVATPAVTAAATAAAIDPVTGFQPLTPARILDTRSTRTPLGTGASRTVVVLGRGGIPSTGVAAVALTLTAVSPTRRSYVTAYPSGQGRPTTSTLSLGAGETVANGVVIGVGTNGAVTVYNLAGSVHLLVDVTGWFPTAAGVSAVAPTRILDTRTEATASGGGALTAGRTRGIAVRGVAGVPTGAIAVSLNVTATAATGAGFVTVYPSGVPAPGTATVHVVPGESRANTTLATLGRDGGIALATTASSVQVVLDVTGYVTSASGYVALPVPVRVGDTRAGTSWRNGGYGRAGRTSGDAAPDTFSTTAPERGRSATLPTDPGAVVVTVSAIRPSARGWVSVWPDGLARPVASTINLPGGATVVGSAIVGTPQGRVDLTVTRGVTSDITIDVSGYWPASATGSTTTATAGEVPSGDLLGIGRAPRDNANGTDRIGVAFCESADRTALERATIIDNLNATVTGWFRRQSRGRYTPTFQDAGRIAVSRTDRNCIDKLPKNVADSAYNGALGIVGQDRNPYSASGMSTAGVTDGTQSYPANHRHGQVTASSVYAFGPVSPFDNITAHELGHMLDWPHSYVPGGGAYSNPMDVMSGSPDAYAGKFAPQGTLAINRYRSGWLDRSEVRVHTGGTATYAIAPLTATGIQMVVIPSGTAGRFTTLDARVRSGDDRYLDKAGVEVTLVDQPSGSRSGLGTRQAPAWGAPGSTSHVLAPGQRRTLGGVTISVGSLRSDGTYPVMVTGTTYDFPSLLSGTAHPTGEPLGAG